MSRRKSVIWIAGSSLILAMLACNIGARKPAPIPTNSLPSNTPGISVESSATETQTDTPTETQPAPAKSLTPIPATNTASAPTLTMTPQNPLVTATAYCWSGPTSKTLTYEVISSIQAGTAFNCWARALWRAGGLFEILGITIRAGYSRNMFRLIRLTISPLSKPLPCQRRRLPRPELF